MTRLVVMAMRIEAAPILDALGTSAVGRRSPWPHVEWHSTADGSTVVALNGTDPVHGVDSIGTTAAALTTLVSIERWNPSWIISAGTAGGFLGRGGHIGQVIVADGPLIHHDRRIPLEGFDELGRGLHPTADLSAIAVRLGFTAGPCSSGDSLDAPPQDLEAMAAHGTLAKDMEAAAVAGVAARRGVRFTALKVITDLVDGELATADEFAQNLDTASTALADALPRLLASLPD